MSDDATLLHLRQEADNGSPQAMYRLANELVVRHEMQEALHLHHRAAEAGMAEAQIEYARMQLHGIAQLACRWCMPNT